MPICPHGKHCELRLLPLNRSSSFGASLRDHKAHMGPCLTLRNWCKEMLSGDETRRLRIFRVREVKLVQSPSWMVGIRVLLDKIQQTLGDSTRRVATAKVTPT